MEKFDLKSPLRTNILVLKIGGLWPRDDTYPLKNSYTFYALTCFIFIVFCHNLSQVINVYFIYDQLETLATSILVTVAEVTGMMKFFLFYKNIKIVKRLMHMLEGRRFQPKNPKQKVLLGGFLQEWRKVYLVFSVSAGMTIFLWGLYPLLDRSYKKKNLPFIAWYPYDYKVSPLYELTYVYQIIANFFLAFTNQNIDAFISALLMYIAAQCALLCDSLKNLKYQEKGQEEFIECVKHHQKILSFAENANQFLSIITFVQFMTSVISICMTMFQLTVVTPLTPTFYTLVCCTSAVFTQVFVYCWFGNNVIINSDEIGYSAFESGFWIDSPMENRKDLVFFLMRCGKPIQLTAVGFFGLSLQTFMAILKTSWSYFALLHQMNNEI